MDGWNYIILYVLIASFGVALVLRVGTKMRALWVAGLCVVLVFVLGLIGWFSAGLALLMASLAAVPALVGDRLGALIVEWRGR